MSYFDQASLVMIPSGYKTSKVYSVKPTDGSGDLTFSRSNDTATRVNSAGLIEKVRTNRVLYSELQTDVVYFKNASIDSITAASNPLTGQNDAFKITSNTGNDPYFLQNVSGLSNGENTFSCWLWTDAGQSTEATLFFYNQTASEVYTKAITLTTTPTRFDHTVNFSNIGSTATVRVDLRQTGPSIQYIYTYGWQAESGVATDYIATTSAAVSVGPVANVPRLDYLGSTCGKLILEPQRTNLRTSSEQFSSLSPSNVTVTSNDTTSPDGYTNADKLTPSGSGFHTIGNSISVTAGQKYTISVFYKYGTHKNIGFYDNNTAGSEITINMETNDFTLGGSVEAGGVIPYGNGWYRAYATFTTGSSDMVNYIIFRDNTNNGNYTADGSYSWFYGWQVELGAYATSYIPTLGAAVTRGADSASKTGISSLIGQTEGTLFADFTLPTMANTGANLVSISLFNAGLTNTTQFDIYDTGDLLGTCVNGTVQALITKSGFTAGRHKVALGYKANDFVLYVDGTLVGTDTSGTVGAQDSFGLQYGTSQFIGQQYVSQALVFKTRLSNADLATLTTI